MSIFENFETNGNAKLLEEIKNVMISISFDNSKQQRMIKNSNKYFWKYCISEKIKSGWYEYKLVVEMNDGSQI